MPIPTLPPGMLKLDDPSGPATARERLADERLTRLGLLADAGTTDLLPDEYLPNDEELRDDAEDVIPGHHPPDYHGMARRLEEEIPLFRGRIMAVGSKGIMIHHPHGTVNLRIEPGADVQQHFEPETRTLVVRHDAGPKDIMREWVHAMHAMRDAGRDRRSDTLPQYRQLEEEPTMEDIARMGLSNPPARRRTNLPPGMLASGRPEA